MAEDPEDFDMDLDEDLDDEPISKTPASDVVSKTPAASEPVVPGGKQVNLFFMSTIGPGEKKQKLMVNTGNKVGAIKETIGNIFGLNPQDFHLSYGGVTMEEEKPMLDYDVKDGETVLLIPASTAG